MKDDGAVGVAGDGAGVCACECKFVKTRRIECFLSCPPPGEVAPPPAPEINLPNLAETPCEAEESTEFLGDLGGASFTTRSEVLGLIRSSDALISSGMGD